MKYLILVIIFLALYVAVVGAKFWYKKAHLPELPAIQRSDILLGAGQPLRYIAVGDSTAVGEGASSVEHTYAFQVLEHLAQQNSVTYKNIAVSGAKTADVIKTQLQDIIDFNPDVVTISMGANDATHMKPARSILENYKTIIASLTKDTHAQIYLSNIPNFNEGELLPDFYIGLLEYRSKRLNSDIALLATDRVHIVNIHDFGWDTFSSMAETYAADGFHPNDTGYKNWANAFWDRMVQDL